MLHKMDRPICGGHCCSDAAEQVLRTRVRRDLETLLGHHAKSLHGLLETTASTFHKHVLELAKQSENNTHYLFSQVYNRMSVLSRRPIGALYADVARYVNATTRGDAPTHGDGGPTTEPADVDIERSVRDFFADLFPLVYHHALELPTRDFSDDYKSCLRRKIDDIQPFGDIPATTARSMYRSLEATRLLLRALALGSEVLNTTDALLAEEAAGNSTTSSSSSCSAALLKMTYCPRCKGLDAAAKPCFGYCLNVLRGCLSQRIVDMDMPWNSYVDTLEKLVIEVKTHETVYNVDSVIRGLENKLSDAIMYALEHGPNLLKRVKWACGAARFSESTDPPRVAGADPLGGLSASGRPPPTPRSTRIPPTDVQVFHFLASVSQSKGHFSSLADTLCTDETFAVQQDEKECWNGEKIGEYTKTVSKAGSQKYNPEVTIADGIGNVAVDSRVEKLSERLKHMKELIQKHLSPSYASAENFMQGDEADSELDGSGSGKDPMHWSENDDESFNGEGSGSGNGGIYTDKHHPEQSPSDADKDKGSGGGASAGTATIPSALVLLLYIFSFSLIQLRIRNFNVL